MGKLLRYLKLNGGDLKRQLLIEKIMKQSEVRQLEAPWFRQRLQRLDRVKLDMLQHLSLHEADLKRHLQGIHLLPKMQTIKNEAFEIENLLEFQGREKCRQGQFIKIEHAAAFFINVPSNATFPRSSSKLLPKFV